MNAPLSANPTLLEQLLFPPVSLNQEKLTQCLQGKTILITGASYGIGEAIAYQLARDGVHLILLARTEEKLGVLKEQLSLTGARVTVCVLDLAKPEEIGHFLQTMQEELQHLGLFINNAGISICRALMDSLERLHDFERTMQLNYFAPVALSLALIPYLKNNRGQIINISAINVLLAPTPYWCAYQASKSAFDQWLRCATPELQLAGIQTSSVYLPLVRTRMLAPNQAYQHAPAMSVAHAAKIVARLIVTQKSRYLPWWGMAGVLASALFGRLWMRLCVLYLKRKKDHAPAD